MEDILKKYKKNKSISNISIILTSLILAFWINLLFFDNTDIWKNLKTSVLNSELNQEKSNLYIDKSEDNIYINSGIDIKQVTSLSLSLTYNPNNINIDDVKSEIANVINISNTPWINSIILTFDKPVDINKTDKIINLIINKKINKIENINILNANFKDINSNQYSLTTSWMTF